MRRGLRRLSTGLIAYGLIGLALAFMGAFALAWVGGRVGAVADRTGEQVESIVSTLDETANVLASMGTSATSFSGTLERTPPAVRQTATTVANLRSNLTLVQGQLAAINILGARPLADAANLFGQMAEVEKIRTAVGDRIFLLEDVASTSAPAIRRRAPRSRPERGETRARSASSRPRTWAASATAG